MFSVIFDMDGTLLDTQRIYGDAWEYVGSRMGIADMGKHALNIAGTNENGTVAYLKEHFPSLNIEEFRGKVKKFVSENLVVAYKSGAKELLEFLKENGVKTALASGTSRPSVEHHLREVDANKYFLASVCGTEVENGKPAPDIFLRAASLIGAKPSDCFVFEDSANGVRAAHAAGMKCIGVADIVPFTDEVRSLMFKELSTLKEAALLLKKYLQE